MCTDLDTIINLIMQTLMEISRQLSTVLAQRVICTKMTAHRVSTDGWEVVVAVLDMDNNSG